MAEIEELPTSVQIQKGAKSASLIADEIEKMADAAEALLNDSGLTRRAIVVLLRDQTGLPMSEIGMVLDALPELRELVK